MSKSNKVLVTITIILVIALIIMLNYTFYMKSLSHINHCLYEIRQQELNSVEAQVEEQREILQRLENQLAEYTQ